jgi:hypothetical protein
VQVKFDVVSNGIYKQIIYKQIYKQIVYRCRQTQHWILHALHVTEF